jgi:hypothetical protein
MQINPVITPHLFLPTCRNWTNRKQPWYSQDPGALPESWLGRLAPKKMIVSRMFW